MQGMWVVMNARGDERYSGWMALDVFVTRPQSPRDTPPVTLIHGAWHGSWCWTDHFAGYLAERGYTSYAVDLRGHGESPGNLRRTRIAHYVADVRTVVRALDADPVLVGHSMGGFVVQHYLARYRARAGVLMAPVPVHGAALATIRVAIRHTGAFARANATWSLGPIVDEPARARSLLFGPDLDADDAARHTSRVQDESYLAFLEMLLERPNPAKVHDPMLVVGGELDALFSPGEIRRTAAAYGTEAIIFDGIGHDMMLDAGWEKPADAIVSWIDALPRPV
jgi:pimeloyl-ACP methyl ester carboxylesterase